MDISSTHLNKTQSYIEDERLQRPQEVPSNQISTKNQRDALAQPAADTTKTAQTATDIVISSGKNLNQVVIENSAPVKPNETGRSASAERDLGSISTLSPIGAQADKNVLPPEISSKSEY